MSCRGGTDGYALLDALVAVLLVAIIAAAILPGLQLGVRFAAKSAEETTSIIESRNEKALLRVETGGE